VDATAAPAPPASVAGDGAEPIRLEGVSKRYPDGTVAVRELDLTFAAGELTVLVGPSGCGKTTTMKMINRIIEPSTGRILLGDDDVTRVDPVQLRRRIGYVIQSVGLFPHQTIRRNVATVPRLLGWDKARTRDRVEELLELVGLDPATFGDRYPHQLSGGQRQRVMIARALMMRPKLLVADEATSMLDASLRVNILNVLTDLRDELGMTVLFITHDIGQACYLADRVLVMEHGVMVEQGPTDQVIFNPQHEYTKRLLADVPKLHEAIELEELHEIVEPR
jgi:osmoprotectant transport system ATP-binding protein